jgi:hypothetical protein
MTRLTSRARMLAVIRGGPAPLETVLAKTQLSLAMRILEHLWVKIRQHVLPITFFR